MILTEKANKDFYKWINNNGYHEEVIYNSVINALIIEWLDSVGIYITIQAKEIIMRDKHTTKATVFDSYVNFNIHGVWITRQQATEQAIIKAVEIYNNRGN